jgi:hypothetical protein
LELFFKLIKFLICGFPLISSENLGFAWISC